MRRVEEAQGYGEDFLQILALSEEHARQMEEALVADAADRAGSADTGLMKS